MSLLEAAARHVIMFGKLYSAMQNENNMCSLSPVQGPSLSLWNQEVPQMNENGKAHTQNNISVITKSILKPQRRFFSSLWYSFMFCCPGTSAKDDLDVEMLGLGVYYNDSQPFKTHWGNSEAYSNSIEKSCPFQRYHYNVQFYCVG